MSDVKTSDRDVNRAIRSWLHEDRHEDVSRVAGAVLDQVDTIPQRRATWWPARRTPIMNKFVTIGLGTAAVVVIGLFLGYQLLGSPTSNLGGPAVTPSPTAEPTATPEPSVAEPTSSADAFLPEGPLLVWDSQDADAPSITMTISAPGWIYHTDFSALEKGEEVENMPEALVLPGSLPPGTGFYVPEDPCQWASTRPETPATTADEIVAALAAQASRDASEPLDVTVDGYAGKMITLHVPDDADFSDCDDGEFVSYTNEAGEPWHWHQGTGQIDDFWFVDVEGSLVEIRASYRPDTSDDLVEEMRTLIESTSFQFP